MTIFNNINSKTNPQILKILAFLMGNKYNMALPKFKHLMDEI